MNDISFKSLNELYIRLFPAFNTKVRELHNDGLKVKEIDLWNCLSSSKWKNVNKLYICDMVNDIFELSLDELKMFLAQK